MRLCPLEPCRQSCRVGTHPWLPLHATPRESHQTRFALPGVVSHLQAVHVLQGEHGHLQACECSRVTIPLLTKLMSPHLSYFFTMACSFQGIILLLSRPTGGLFSGFNRASQTGPGGRKVACSRSLTGSRAGNNHIVSVTCSRGLTGLDTMWLLS